MGRGSAYGYEHFMLVDDMNWDEHEWESFKEEVITVFDLMSTNARPEGRDSWYLGETKDIEDVVYVGIDTSGGFPCIFAEPQYGKYEMEEYVEDHEESYSDYIDRIDQKIVEGFNRLLEIYPSEFRTPTSAWTSETISRYVG